MTELKLTDLVDLVGAWDPAGTPKKREKKAEKSRAAMAIVGQDTLGRVFVLESWSARATIDEQVDLLFTLHDRWKPQRFGGEANAMQEGLQELVDREARYKRKALRMEKIVQPTGIDKTFRIRSVLQPIVAHGRLFILDQHVELHRDLTSFPMLMAMDRVDVLAMAIDLLPKRIATAQVQEAQERQALAASLRAQGLPPSYIERRMTELAGEPLASLARP